MIHGQTALAHHLFQVAVGELVPAIPSDAQKMSDGSKCRHLNGDELFFTARASGGDEVREQGEYNQKSNFCNTTCIGTLMAGREKDFAFIKELLDRGLA